MRIRLALPDARASTKERAHGAQARRGPRCRASGWRRCRAFGRRAAALVAHLLRARMCYRSICAARPPTSTMHQRRGRRFENGDDKWQALGRGRRAIAAPRLRARRTSPDRRRSRDAMYAVRALDCELEAAKPRVAKILGSNDRSQMMVLHVEAPSALGLWGGVPSRRIAGGELGDSRRVASEGLLAMSQACIMSFRLPLCVERQPGRRR